MRRIPFSHMAVFLTILTFLLVAAGLSLWAGALLLNAGVYIPVLQVGLFPFLFFALAVVAYRTICLVLPLQEGFVRPGTKNEWAYDLHIFFYLMIFYPVTRSGFLPLPLMRLVYQALGARLGENTYPSGMILDPLMTEIGANTIVGQGAILAAHNLVGKKLFHRKIKIGDNVTIGGQVMIGAGVLIGDRAIISGGAIICPRAKIDAGVIVAPGVVIGVGVHVRNQSERVTPALVENLTPIRPEPVAVLR